MKKSSFQNLYPFFALFLALYTLIFPLQSSFFVNKAIGICLGSLVPSLFPFMLLIRFYCEVKPDKKPSRASVLLSRLLGVAPSLSGVTLLGMFSGFPVGASGIKSLYARGLCTKEQAQRAVCLSNNCSAAFIIGTVGAGLLKSVKLGYVLFAAQLMSVITAAQLLKLFGTKDNTHFDVKAASERSEKPKSSVFIDCVKSTMSAMINLCGFVLFFYLLSGIICDNLGFVLAKANAQTAVTAKTIICGVLEMTSGVFSAAAADFPRNVLLCSAVTSFSGLSVYFQVKDAADGLDVSAFIPVHLLLSVLSPMYTLVILYFLPSLANYGASLPLLPLSSRIIAAILPLFAAGLGFVAPRRAASGKNAENKR